jgi:hypothetical protein
MILKEIGLISGTQPRRQAARLAQANAPCTHPLNFRPALDNGGYGPETAQAMDPGALA